MGLAVALVTRKTKKVVKETTRNRKDDFTLNRAPFGFNDRTEKSTPEA